MPSATGFLGHRKGLTKNVTAAAFLSKVSSLTPHTSHPEKMKALPPPPWSGRCRSLEKWMKTRTRALEFSLTGAPLGLLQPEDSVAACGSWTHAGLSVLLLVSVIPYHSGFALFLELELLASESAEMGFPLAPCWTRGCWSSASCNPALLCLPEAWKGIAASRASP